MPTALKRSALAVWKGDLKTGKGQVSTGSGSLKDSPYTFATRFEDSMGTNPEELIAAAHAGCFTMAVSSELGKAGFRPERLATTATVILEQLSGSPVITKVQLELKGRVPGIDAGRFAEITAGAKANCPVSKVLRAEITLQAALED
ncbi:MAG TPA: OsmC family protein [Opitutaceae bacterium]|jgi:osmotically inducible protein OsmC